MTAQGTSYIVSFNNPAVSKVVNQMVMADHPPAAEFKTKWGGAAPTFTYVWGMLIPANATSKEWSWDLISRLSSKEDNLILSMQGTDVGRSSVYSDPAYLNYWKNIGGTSSNYPAVLGNVLKYGRASIPGLDTFSQVSDLVGKEAVAAILGQKTAQQAMNDLAAELKPLVPTPTTSTT
jgi:ABC-type glycerol-3-phosphate transport system substrate-binding protein